MIKLNTPYTIEDGKDQVIFIEGKKGTINGTYSDATLTGTLEGNLLKATFHNKKVNATGLMEITFHENGFDAQWKTGLEPGPMRGKWEGSFESNQNTLNSLFTHDEFYKLTSENRFQKVFEFIENIVQSKDIDAVSEFSDFIKGFVNKNPECFWMILATSQKLEKLRIQFEEEAELCDFISEFDSQLTEDLDVDLKEKFNLFFYSNNDGGEWSKIEDGNLMTFSEIILSEANLDLSSDNFDWNKYTNYAISHLWIGLQNYTSKNAGRIDEDDLAFCLNTVFEERYEPMSDLWGDANQDVLVLVINLIMQLDFNEFNAEENDDLEYYGAYTTDYKKIAEEILNVDIFDLYPYK